MANDPLVSPAEYPAVRAVIDLQLTETSLEDSVIALDIYSGAAQREVLAIDPDALTRTGEDERRVVAAAVYLTAARLVYAVVRMTSQSVTVRDASFSRATFDPDERAAELRARAMEELSFVVDIPLPVIAPPVGSRSVRLTPTW